MCVWGSLDYNINFCIYLYRLFANMRYVLYQVVDRQGRTCLHLAVLHIGKEHSQAVTMEEEEMLLQAQLAAAKRQVDETHAKRSAGKSNNDAFDDSDYDEDGAEHGGVNNAKNVALELMERDSKSRDILRFLVSVYPQALCMLNNFQATPVDTVLEKTKPVRAKNKIVSVYGLYDDPPTARLLLLAQRNRSRAFNPTGFNSSASLMGSGKVPCILSNLRPRYLTALRDFNWMARKDVLYVSFVGELRYCNTIAEAKNTKQQGGSGGSSVSYVLKYNPAADNSCVHSNPAAAGGGASTNKTAVSASAKRTPAAKGKTAAKSAKPAATPPGDDVHTVFTQMAGLQISSNNSAAEAEDVPIVMDHGGYSIPKNNLLARCRRQGMEELVRAIVAFI